MAEKQITRFPVTPQGFYRLQSEIDSLKKEMLDIIKAIEEARAHGDLSENAEYHSAREKQSLVEGRIRELEYKMSTANVIDVASMSGDVVMFGATVTLQLCNDEDDSDEDDSNLIYVYQIVSEYEADVTKQMISINSPVARALIGKKKGDYAEVRTPKGEEMYKIINVEFK